MWVTGILLVSFLALVVFILFSQKRFKYWKIRGIPYKEPSLLFGSLSDVFKFKKSIGMVLKDIHLETSEPYVGLFFLAKPVLLIKDRNLIKSIMVKNFDIFSDKNMGADEHSDYLSSQTLFLAKSTDWGIMRKKVTPVYTSGKMKSMYSLIAETGKDLVRYLSKTDEETFVINCKEVFLKYGTEVIISTAFGIKPKCFEEENSEFISTTQRIFNFNSLSRAFSTTCYMVAPILVRLFKLKYVDTESASFLRSVFWETVKRREESNILRNDLIHTLLEIRNKERIEGNKDFDGEKLLAQAVIFYIGGFETSSSTISFALYELARHPEIQNKLRQEIEDGLNNYESSNYDLLKDLPYMDMVFKETLRMYPVLPFLDRKSRENYTIPGTSHVIEEGVGVYVSSLGLHMDPDNFPEPEEFIPERFSPENIKDIKPFSYVPFGEGPRNCIGARFGALSVKSALVNIIANFEVELCEDTPKIEFHPRAFLLTPRSGDFPLKLTKITKTK